MAELLDRLKAVLSDRYTIERPIGQGGMADVFLGRDLKYDRQVAIKVMRPEIASAVNAERFRRETEAEASLSHPHVLPLHDSGEADGLLYFVTPYVEGESLKARLTRESQLPVAEAVRIARQVADALGHAHERGIIHRDIKPGNILLSGKHALVADFGICRAMESAGDETLTSSGILVGTPAYMSPEQADSAGHIDGRSDIYALGCVLYEMLIGEPPFTGQSAQVVVARHLRESVPSLSVARPGIPASVEAVVLKALQKSAADRYQSAAEFQQDLRQLETDLSVRSVASGLVAAPVRIGRHLGGWRRLAAAVLVLGLIGTVVAVFRSRVLEPGPVYAVDNPHQNFIVLPHRLTTTDEEEAELVLDAATELTRLLYQWDEITAVPNSALLGLLFDEGLRDPLRTTLGESFRVARRALAGTLIVLTLEIRGDSAVIDANQYDVATQQPREQPIGNVAQRANLSALVEPVAYRVLGIAGAPEEARIFRRQSQSLAALQEQVTGKRHLDRWELEAAEASFERAIRADSAIPLANHYLAMTLYWEAARDWNRLRDLGGSILRHSVTARRHAAGLPYRDSLHIDGFRAFAEGRFGRARDVYQTLILRDSLDSYAWLMLGSTDLHDYQLKADLSDRPAPRSNLNRAVRAFEHTIQYSPDFFLGYAHLVGMHSRIADQASAGVCTLFEPAGTAPSPMWERVDTEYVESLTPFCPVLLDSITWVEQPRLASIDPARLAGGPARLLERAEGRIRRWVDYAPESPQPRQQLADLLLAQRRHLHGGGPAADSLVREALVLSGRALAVRTDTTPEELIRLGALLLAAGDLDSAVTMTERGLELHSTRRAGEMAPPPLAMNVLLAAGNLSQAVEVSRPAMNLSQIFVPDPSGGPLRQVWVDADVGELRAYGATGFDGPALHSAFERIEETWTSRGFGEVDRRVLRQGLISYVALALALDRQVLVRWIEDSEKVPESLAGLAVVDSDPDAARQLLEAGLVETPIAEQGPTSAFLFGTLAQRLGKHRTALELFDRLQGAVLDVESHRHGIAWGLRSRSLLLMARSHMALGESEAARKMYARFLDAWERADAVFEPLLYEAREALAHPR